MNRYKESMDKITLAPSADERIRRNIQAAADQSERRRNIMKKGRWKRNIFRNLSAASVAAVLTLTIAVTAFAAGLIRIVLKTQNWGNYSEISFEAADESYVDLKPYLPESMPEIAVGDVITAYTTGVSTMSLPPQMNAVAIVK